MFRGAYDSEIAGADREYTGRYVIVDIILCKSINKQACGILLLCFSAGSAEGAALKAVTAGAEVCAEQSVGEMFDQILPSTGSPPGGLGNREVFLQES